MKTKSILAFAFCVCLLGLLSSCSRGDSNLDKTIGVKADDPDMAAAIVKARGLLPEFWRVFEHPEHGESDFCLKVKITDKEEVEHFWAVDIERKDGTIRGTINNDPEFVKTVKLGQRIQVNEADISDWLYTRDGKMHGNYTMRAMFKQMPAKEVEEYKKMLADP